MKTLLLAAVMTIPMLHIPLAGAAPVEPRSDDEKVSYLVGVRLAEVVATLDAEFDNAQVVEGFRASLAGNDNTLSSTERKALLRILSNRIEAARMQGRKTTDADGNHGRSSGSAGR